MPNRLAHEKSPYLLQHADNPVDWYPWGQDAFDKARREQKPVFLSIGYSTCHWCHVMAHESFEDPRVASLLNEHFVPIKVDREERPDVDRIYMTYVQAATGHGGWPLSAWLTPELKPFFGGTYFPPDDRHGRTGFVNVLNTLAEGWRQDRDKMVAESERVVEVLRAHFGAQPGGLATTEGPDLTVPGREAFEKAFRFFRETFDATDGGFGGAPKFPRAANLNFLFRVSAREGWDSAKGGEALKMAEVTLQKMAQGGLHDHVGGGFHRYSVDEEWFVPHFEKMLYDQAQIAINCLDAYQATGRAAYAWVARDIIAYVRRDLTSPSGGFYSAEDADSQVSHGRPEHAEGAFYLWTRSEIEQVLGAEATLFCAHYDVQEAGNVGPERDPQNEFRGKNLLRQRQSVVATAQAFSLTPEVTSERMVVALEQLRGVRERRPRPLLDDKVITAWNGLMISALARAAQVLGDAAAATAAIRAAEFIRAELYAEERGVLFRSFREGRGAAEGFAEDYAFLIQGLIDLYETCFDIRWLQWAVRLQATMDEFFWDYERGGYCNSAAGEPSLVLRLKEDYDGAEPAPSSVAAMNLLRLAPVSGNEPVFRARALRTLDAFRVQWSRSPHALPQMLCALDYALEPPRQVVIAGNPQSADFCALLAVVRERPGRGRSIFAADGGEWQRWLAAHAPWMSAMQAAGGRAMAYLCEHYTCQPATSDPAVLRARLG